MPQFQLKKGGNFTFDKGIQRVKVALGWDAAGGTSSSFDLDASVFGLFWLNGTKPTFYGDGSHAVFYGNRGLKDPKTGVYSATDGSLVHTGDNRTGAGDGDDEVITVDFSKLPAGIDEIAVWITIYEAGVHKQNFGMVQNSYVRIDDLDTGTAIVEYKLREGFTDETAVQVGSFTKNDEGLWVFTALGAGAVADIQEVVNKYM